MNRALSLQAQIFISILIGMGFSFMLARSFPPTILSPHPSTPDFLTPTVIPLATFTVAAPATPTSLPMPLETGTPAPYITLPGVWMVRIQFFLDSPPKILKATYPACSSDCRARVTCALSTPTAAARATGLRASPSRNSSSSGAVPLEMPFPANSRFKNRSPMRNNRLTCRLIERIGLRLL